MPNTLVLANLLIEAGRKLFVRRSQCSRIHTNDTNTQYPQATLLDKARLGCRLNLSSQATHSNQFHRRNAKQKRANQPD